jgi:hypothetical protein
MNAHDSGKKPFRQRFANAGINFRPAKSPVAPNKTKVNGSGRCGVSNGNIFSFSSGSQGRTVVGMAQLLSNSARKIVQVLDFGTPGSMSIVPS